MRLFCLLIFISMGLGCEALFREAPVAPPLSPGAGGSPPGRVNPSSKTPPAPQSQSEWGVIKCSHSQEAQRLFNQQLKRFLSSKTDPQTMIWFVNCSGRSDLKGGTWIRGSVQFKDGDFDPQSTSQNLIGISASSYIEIHIVASNGRPVATLGLKAVEYSSKVEGSFIILAFEDGGGKVFLEGEVENGLFTGVFNYQNSKTYTGQSGGYRGTIGKFSIPVCSLIQCATPK